MAKPSFLILAFILLICCSDDDSSKPESTLYFPPAGFAWETLSPSSLGWNEAEIAELDAFLDDTDTRALIVLKDGKMVIEKYAGKQLINTSLDFTSASNWYWASAGKTLTSTLVGIAEAQGKIDFEAKTSDYLGAG